LVQEGGGRFAHDDLVLGDGEVVHFSVHAVEFFVAVVATLGGVLTAFALDVAADALYWEGCF